MLFRKWLIFTLTYFFLHAVYAEQLNKSDFLQRTITDPRQPGDVVGRDLSVPALGSVFGHVGMWNGENVVEALNEGGSNALHINSLDNFKSRSPYWGAAFFNIPNFMVYNCFEATCPDYELAPRGSVHAFPTRLALAKKAYQQVTIGADYTLGGSS